jgi:tRNA A-37 threonylcarbamoyl transferase component Bud32/Tfp pilus assembly protein PilF
MAGFVFLANPLPLHAKAEASEKQQSKAMSDSEYNELMAGIDSALGNESDPTDPSADATRSRVWNDFQNTWAQFQERFELEIDWVQEESIQLLPASPEQLLTDIRAGNFTLEVRSALLKLLGMFLVFAITVRIIRGTGDIAISIHYPAELRGTFNVRISKRASPGQHRRIANSMNSERRKTEAGVATRFEHTMVSRETRFQRLRSRRYCVMVYGYLQPMEGERIIATHLDEIEIRVRRGRTERVDFDFHPEQCIVDVSVVWDRRPVTDAMVTLREDPGTPRFTRTGPARLEMDLGTHTLVVGSGDRVSERALDITSRHPFDLEVDLGGNENMLFRGCPPAVQPYLHGDHSAAARALEREGQPQVAHLILARLHQERGQSETAANHFEAAGRPLEAAVILEALNDFEKSAQLFSEGGEPARAGEMWLAAGAPSQAGEAYERANQFDAAVRCYQESGDISKWTTALERNGAPFQAAQISIDHDDWSAAIRSLQQVPESDPEYIAATHLLIDAYEKGGHMDLALHKAEQLVDRDGYDDAPLEACDRLAHLLEEDGEFERSLGLLEIVRQRDTEFPNVQTRIEDLKKRLNEDAPTGSIDNDQTQFTGESRYEMLSELGRGGMGVVYKARDRRLGRVVAIKRLPENLQNHPKAVQLFLREARSAAALNHPNIVTVFDAGQEDGILFMTMELLEGLPLQKILRSRGKLTARDTARLGIQIAKGLEYAHKHRIIHRDIKTGNLFFTDDKKMKIMDFGLAKMVQQVERESTVIGGTPYYMAPEQSLGEAIDHRADLYSLGVTFFELVTGRVPFSEGDVAYHHRHTPPPDAREFVADLPEAFAQLISDLIKKVPDERCSSATEVIERLQPLST